MDELKQQVEKTKRQVAHAQRELEDAQRRAGAENAALGAVNTEIGALEEQLAGCDSADVTSLAAALAAAEARRRALGRRVEAAGAAVKAADRQLADATRAHAAAQLAVADAESRADADRLEQRVRAIESELRGLLAQHEAAFLAAAKIARSNGLAEPHTSHFLRPAAGAREGAGRQWLWSELGVALDGLDDRVRMQREEAELMKQFDRRAREMMLERGPERPPRPTPEKQTGPQVVAGGAAAALRSRPDGAVPVRSELTEGWERR